MDINNALNLDANHLVVFYVAATEGSLTAAAGKLHLSQPAITYHIKCLEEAVHLKLIGFKKQQLVCTPAGEAVLQYAGEIYQQLINVEKMTEFFRKQSLKVGIGPLFLPVITPVLQTIFEEQFPEIKLIIKSGTAFDMADDIVDYRLDVVIAPHWDYGHKTLKYITVSNPEKLVCFASPRHPLNRQHEVRLKELSGFPIVIGPESTALNRMVFQKFQSEGLDMTPRFTAEVNSTELSKRLVEDSGSSIGFSLAKDVEKEVSAGSLQVLPLKEDIWITAAAILRSDTYMHPILERFIAMARQAFGYEENGVTA